MRLGREIEGRRVALRGDLPHRYAGEYRRAGSLLEIGVRANAEETLAAVDDIKKLDQRVAVEELAALVQQTAPMLRLKTTKLEDDDEGEAKSF